MSTIAAAGFSAGSSDGELASLEARLGHLADMGAEAVELALSSLDLISGGRIVPERARRLEALTSRFPFRYSVHGLVSSNFMDPETLPHQMAAARAMVELSAAVGAGVLVHHGGALRARQIAERAGARSRERDALTELAEHARPHGVRIALENIFSTQPGEYRQSPSELADTVRLIGHPNLVALIDFSHAYIEASFRGLDFREQVRAMGPVTGHLHVHDSFGRPIGSYVPYHPQEATALGLGDLHLPLGWGDIPWREIFDEIELLPDTLLIMEIGDRYAAEQPESLALARELMARANARKAMAAE